MWAFYFSVYFLVSILAFIELKIRGELARTEMPAERTRRREGIGRRIRDDHCVPFSLLCVWDVCVVMWINGRQTMEIDVIDSLRNHMKIDGKSLFRMKSWSHEIKWLASKLLRNLKWLRRRGSERHIYTHVELALARNWEWWWRSCDSRFLLFYCC